mmetsp:Transcript_25743/g.63041  ORF Transcript_25743/g.63041 Transcript_25743/m.63041 type:complete len:114 (+) Transcript_25743:331-672(+)
MALMRGVGDGGGGMQLPWSMNSQRAHRWERRHMGSKHHNHGEHQCRGMLDRVQQDVDSGDGRQSSGSVDKLCDTLHHSADNRVLVLSPHIFPGDYGQGMKAMKPMKSVLDSEK